MILFLDEERTYLHWIAHHRAGFVLDCYRKPTKSRLVLHRATCPEIKASAGKRTHWTTGRHMKACALEREALTAWAVEQAQAEPKLCPSCWETSDSQDDSTDHSKGGEGAAHLSRLESEVLTFVLEVAALHLDDRDASYRLTVGKTAQCLSKTPGQFNAALGRLAEAGLLKLVGKIKPGEPAPPGGRLLPTVAALKMLPAYEGFNDEAIEAELASLADEQEP
ncbi:MAG TPA: hypothetical protein VMV10_21420 [Pirellulales bacterium]|nr:hypothetical protein [Pirellulales bacterium]